jgi:hypothetical protein
VTVACCNLVMFGPISSKGISLKVFLNSHLGGPLHPGGSVGVMRAVN